VNARALEATGVGDAAGGRSASAATDASLRPNRMKESSVPLLTFSVEATASGATLTFGRLADFATDHGVGPAVRERARAVAADIVNALAGAFSGTARLQIEADIGEHDLQLVVAHEGDDARLALIGLRRRLEPIGSRCDEFAAERAGAAGIEVWCRFILR
jgi:hypothetical protein